jgi:hypothetical protein
MAWQACSHAALMRDSASADGWDGVFVNIAGFQAAF